MLGSASSRAFIVVAPALNSIGVVSWPRRLSVKLPPSSLPMNDAASAVARRSLADSAPSE